MRIDQRYRPVWAGHYLLVLALALTPAYTHTPIPLCRFSESDETQTANRSVTIKRAREKHIIDFGIWLLGSRKRQTSEI